MTASRSEPGGRRGPDGVGGIPVEEFNGIGRSPPLTGGIPALRHRSPGARGGDALWTGGHIGFDAAQQPLDAALQQSNLGADLDARPDIFSGGVITLQVPFPVDLVPNQIEDLALGRAPDQRHAHSGARVSELLIKFTPDTTRFRTVSHSVEFYRPACESGLVLARSVAVEVVLPALLRAAELPR